jgi:hypothetical protein
MTLQLLGAALLVPDLFELRLTYVGGDQIRFLGDEKIDAAWTVQEWWCQVDQRRADACTLADCAPSRFTSPDVVLAQVASSHRVPRLRCSASEASGPDPTA